jgi:hypothetical protein
MQKCFSSCWLFYCFICSISSQEKQISKAKILDGSWDGESTRQGTTFTFCHTITIYSSIDNGVLNCHSFLLNIYWPNLDKGFQLFLRQCQATMWQHCIFRRKNCSRALSSSYIFVLSRILDVTYCHACSVCVTSFLTHQRKSLAAAFVECDANSPSIYDI